MQDTLSGVQAKVAFSGSSGCWPGAGAGDASGEEAAGESSAYYLEPE